MFSLKTYKTRLFYNVLHHPKRSTGKTAGEMVSRSGSHPAGHSEFTLLGLNFCLHSAAEVCQTKIGFRARDAQSALQNVPPPPGMLPRSEGSDHPGRPPSLTRAIHHGTRLGSAPVLRATGVARYSGETLLPCRCSWGAPGLTIMSETPPYRKRLSFKGVKSLRLTTLTHF